MARVSLDTLKRRSISNMGDVHPAVKAKTLSLIEQAYAEGINVQISMGKRSFTQQAQIYGQGRSHYWYKGHDYGHPGNVVSNAKPGQSIHNYGYAVDYFLTTYDGSGSTWNVNSNWRRVATLGKKLGFSWGGDWSSFKDYPHLELTGGLDWRDFANGKRPPSHLLEVQSLPDPNDNVLEPSESGQEVKELQEDLMEAGYRLPKFGADGDYGDETVNAVKKFQKENGLSVDGVVGPNTRAKLNEKLEESNMLLEAIVINSAADFSAAEGLANRKKAPIYTAYVAKKEQVAKHVYVVGGDTKGIKADKVTDLSGKDRYETAANVKKAL